MSRRKQSNPKPLKRKLEDDEVEELAEQLCLPRDVLALGECSDSEGEFAVQAIQRIGKGLLFGPYKAKVKAHKSGEREDENIPQIKVSDVSGQKMVVILSDARSQWLKLTKGTTEEQAANLSIYTHGSEIWCQVEEDVQADAKLRSIFCGERTFIGKSSKSPAPSELRTGALTNGNRTSPGKESGSEDDARVPRSPSRNGKAVINGLLPRKVKVERLSPEPASRPKPINENHVEARNSGEEPAAGQTGFGEIFPGAFPYSFPPGAPSGSFIYVNYLPGQQVSPRPSSVSSVSSDQNEPRILKTGYQCSPCGITFSSLRTLEAHQSFYCAHRENPTPAPSAKPTSRSEDSHSNENNKHLGKYHGNRVSNRNKRQSPGDMDENSEQQKGTVEEQSTDDPGHQGEGSSSSSEPKSAKLGRTYPCPFCEYVTDRKGGLNRHMRMHDGTRTNHGRSLRDSPSADSNQASSRYCTNCDIQFSSQKTYQVHKGFYCNTRHVHKATPAPATSPTAGPSHHHPDESPGKMSDKLVPSTVLTPSGLPNQSGGIDPKTGLMFGHPFYAAISTSPLILVPCSYLPGSGIAPPGSIVVPNGNPEEEMPMSPVPAFTVVPNANRGDGTGVATPKVRPLTPKSEMDVKLGESSPSDAVDKPLDLSVRRKSFDSLVVTAKSEVEEEHTNMKLPVSLPAPLVVAAGCLPGSANSLTTIEHVGNSVLVKQGTSKCKECNIVFYKQENYLVHKRLYCASRQNRTKRSSISSPENGGVPSSPSPHSKSDANKDVDVHALSPNTSGSSPGHSPKPTKCSTTPPPPPPAAGPQAVYQFYCIACGIKFTSFDNLKAHQTYYCPKREALTGTKGVGLVPVTSPPIGVRGNDFRCTKCKNYFPTEETLRCHPCGSQRKCPYCDVYCPTLSAAQRHLVTHTGVKAFRCTICGYKGHTLRGMRTHIRIHLDSGSNTPEEQYIVCVGEDGVAVGNRTKRSAPNSPQDDSDSKSRDSSRGTPNLSEDSDITAGGSGVGGNDSQHFCQFCGYTSTYKGNVVRHIKLVHRDRDLLPSPPGPPAPLPNRASPSHRATVQHRLESPSPKKSPNPPNLSDSELSNDSREGSDRPDVVSVKSEPKDDSGMSDAEALAQSRLADMAGTGTKKSGPKYCKACDISFKHLSNFVAHKKYYCTPQMNDSVEQETATV